MFVFIPNTVLPKSKVSPLERFAFDLICKLRSVVSDIGLIYPALPFEPQSAELPVYEIVDEFTNGITIKIHPFKVNIVHEDGLAFDVSGRLENIFKSSSQKLILQLNDSVKNIKTSRLEFT